MAKFYDKECPYIVTLYKGIFKYLENQGFLIINDIAPYIEKGLFLPILTLNDMKNYHTLNDIFQKKYNREVNWNKNDINFLYVIHNVKKYVNINSKKRLLGFYDASILNRAQISNTDSFRITKHNYRHNGVVKFIVQWYRDVLLNENQYDTTKQVMERLFEKTYCNSVGVKKEFDECIMDYLVMALRAKEKINLRWKSFKKIYEAHNEISKKSRQKLTPLIKIPNKSKYIKLRCFLPDMFEWIKTKKRIVEESIIQNNCVWNYADKINSDQCAVYSFIYPENNQRYTIEFCENSESNYSIIQITKRDNLAAENYVYRYIEQFL